MMTLCLSVYTSRCLQIHFIIFDLMQSLPKNIEFAEISLTFEWFELSSSSVVLAGVLAGLSSSPGSFFISSLILALAVDLNGD